MAKVLIVAGFEGTGKSTSLREMNPEDTYIFNVLGKDLPFKGSRKIYNSDNGNIVSSDNWTHVSKAIKAAEERGKKHMIIDDVGYLMSTEFFDRAEEGGYSKFSEIGAHMQSVIKAAKDSKLETVTLMFHLDNDPVTGLNVRTIGRMLNDKYNPAGVVDIMLITHVDIDGAGNASYKFITNRTNKAGVILPAKSPMGMLDLEINNDLNFVIQQINEYYN